MGQTGMRAILGHQHWSLGGRQEWQPLAQGWGEAGEAFSDLPPLLTRLQGLQGTPLERPRPSPGPNKLRGCRGQRPLQERLNRQSAV